MSFRVLRVSQSFSFMKRNILFKNKQKLNMFCTKNSENNKLIVPPQQSQLVANNDLENPWKPINGPQGGIYYWNTLTNETTSVGAPKPGIVDNLHFNSHTILIFTNLFNFPIKDHWVEVKDPNGSELTYWWNPEKNLT